MNRILSYCFFLVAFCAGALFGAEFAQYEDKRVQRIDIESVQMTSHSVFDSNAVREHLRTQVGTLFSQESFDSDLKSLAAQFDRVEPKVEVIHNDIFITLRLLSKPIIRAINWKGNEILKTQDLQKKLDVAVFKPFDRTAFNKAFYKLKEYYVKQGFFEAELQYTVLPIPETNQVDIDIQIVEGRSGRIRDIKFVGFTSDEESDISKLLSTKTYFFLTSWITGTGNYRDEDAERDRILVLDYLHNQGYPDANVTMIVRETSQKKRIEVTITAVKGDKYSFGEVSFSGNTVFNDAQVAARLAAKQGAHYSPEALRDTQEQIKDLYGRKGYIDALVTYQTTLNPQNLSYNVNFNIAEGGSFKVGLIKIFGNVRTQDRVIRNETLLLPGNVFDLRKLKMTERRLLETDYFKTVNVYAVEPEKNSALDPNYRNIHIEVEEKATGKLYFGIGVSTSEKVFGMVRCTEENFNYKGIPNLFKEGISAVRGGGENASIFTRISKMGQTYGLSWSKPYFRDSQWTVGFDVTHSRLDSPSDLYRTRKFGFTLYAAKPLNEFWTFRTQYRFANPKTHVTDKKDASRQLLDDARIKGRVSAIGAGFIYNSTDSFYKPKKGFNSEIFAEYSAKALGALQEFIHTSYSNAYYQPAGKKGTMIYRLDFDFVNPVGRTKYHTLAIDERLFLGGVGSVRGFEDQSVGPKYPGTRDPVGGLSSTLLSLQYRHELFERLDGFVFFDAGYVSAKRYHVATPRHFSKSVGFGIVFELFHRMPIMVGMGFPIKVDKKKDDVQRFFFSLGLNF